MIFTIPTSKEVADKITALQNDEVLKRNDLKILSVEEIFMDKDTRIVTIKWTGDSLADLFFFGYWTNYLSNRSNKK